MIEKIIIGTPYFENVERARDYYVGYHISENDVDKKIKNGEIFIGKPKLKTGERLLLNKEEGRYFIETIKKGAVK